MKLIRKNMANYVFERNHQTAKIDIRYCVSCYMKNLFLLSPYLKSSLGFLIYS